MIILVSFLFAVISVSSCKSYLSLNNVFAIWFNRLVLIERDINSNSWMGVIEQKDEIMNYWFLAIFGNKSTIRIALLVCSWQTSIYVNIFVFCTFIPRVGCYKLSRIEHNMVLLFCLIWLWIFQCEDFFFYFSFLFAAAVSHAYWTERGLLKSFF